MSHVIDVVLVYGLCTDEEADHHLLAHINRLNPRGKLVHVEDPALPPCWFCNGKTLQANVAVGAFNYLPLKAWVDAMRQEIDFAAYECAFVQMLVQDEQNIGFGLVDIWKDPPAFAPFDVRAIEEEADDLG